MNVNDPLGDRMKGFEGAEAQRRLMTGLPILARLDGKAFHTFTKGLERPFCKPFHDLMVATTKYLVEETNAVIGYTQSDEITLVLWADPAKPKSQTFLDGRVLKLTSILASYATAYFNRELPKYLHMKERLAAFDCRVWNVPSETEAVNVLVWREQDAAKNSILCAAQHHFNHKSIQGLDVNQLQEKLFTEAGVNWGQDYLPCQKRGTYVRKVPVARSYTVSEIELLPPKHAARSNPDLVVERSEIRVADMPILTTIRNRDDVVFRGAEPITAPG